MDGDESAVIHVVVVVAVVVVVCAVNYFVMDRYGIVRVVIRLAHSSVPPPRTYCIIDGRRMMEACQPVFLRHRNGDTIHRADCVRYNLYQ